MNLKIYRQNYFLYILGIGILLLLFFGTGPSVIYAQATGKITGIVVEASNKTPLPGANIFIEGTNKGAASAQNGRFNIFKLQPGSYKVTVSFLGYQDISKDIEVTAGQMAELNFELKESILTGEEIVVYGDLARGQAKALQRQKTAQNIVQVVSEEFFSKFPDRNAAETVRRLPSVSISRDQGEGEFIQIRGMDQEYNSLTLNGIRIPAPDPGDGQRSVGLDLVNNRLLGEIEVIKAITPDMDADAIGGTVNFGLRKAPVGGTAVLGAGAGYNNQISDFTTYGRGVGDFYALYGNRFFDNKFGLLVDGAYYLTSRHSKLRELNYTNEGDGPYSEEIFAQHTNDYDVKRQRYGVNLSSDYEFNPSNRIYLTFNYNTYKDDEIRREVEYVIDDEEETRETRNRLEDQRLILGMLGGEHDMGWLKLDYKGAYVKAYEKMPGRTYLRYQRDNPFTGFTNDQIKNFDGTTKFSGLEPNEMNRIRYDDDLKEDADLSGQINLILPFTFMSGELSNFKVGTKLLRKSVSYDRHRFQNDGFNETPPPLDEGTFGFVDVRYNDDALKPYLTVWEERNNLTDSYDATENISSAYGMALLNFTPKITALAGLRYEGTKTDYTQPYPEDADIIGDAPLQGSGSYSNLLPSVHLRYRFDNNNNLKLAYSTGLARPRYEDLVPRMIIDELPGSNSDLGKIEYGNPGLEPRTAYNFDLMYDRFTPYLGLVSVGVFYKRFKAWHTTRVTFEEHDFVDDNGDENPDGIPETYEASQTVMGDGYAEYQGFEINVQQRLNFISSAFKWFALNINYTYTKSKGEVDGREVVMTRSPKHIANGSIIYDHRDWGLSVVLALNYRDAILTGIGDNRYLDVYFDSEFFVDLAVTQMITKKLRLIAQFNGMGRTDEHEVLGDPGKSGSRTQQWEKYGVYGTVGLQYTLW
jgi:outer membrane receptor for ferrienterochelin and colicin